MGEYANFYNSKAGDRLYDASSFEEWLKPFFTTGVFNGELQVTAAGGMQLSVAPGNVNIKGKMRHFEEATSLTLEEADPSYSRIDAIVVRRDDPGRNFVIAVVKGIAAARPVAPELTRNDNFYELQLAEVTVGIGAASVTDAEIKDTRMDDAKCGWVAATVTEIDFTQIQRQFDSYIAQFKTTKEGDYDAWLAHLKEVQAQFEAQLETFKKTNQDGFTAWLAKIKEIFKDVSLGALYLEIEGMNRWMALTIPASGWSETASDKWGLQLYSNTVQVSKIYWHPNGAIEVAGRREDGVGSPAAFGFGQIAAAEGDNEANTITFYSYGRPGMDIYVSAKGVE